MGAKKRSDGANLTYQLNVTWNLCDISQTEDQKKNLRQELLHIL